MIDRVRLGPLQTDARGATPEVKEDATPRFLFCPVSVTLREELTRDMNRIGFSKTALCSLAALMLATGCDQPASQRIPEPFDSAPAEVKQTWERALAADKANDYVTAMAALDWLNKRKLTDPQMNALSAERAEFSERLLKAVMRNDPAAMRAYQNSQKGRGH